MTYETYEPAPFPGPSSELSIDEELGGSGPWRVAIEYSNRSDAGPPTIVQIGRSEHAERDVALRAAKRAAVEFVPPDPWTIKARRVFRDGPDSFLVILDGATSTYHMGVRIVSSVHV